MSSPTLAEHARLDALVRAVGETCGTGDLDDAHAACDRLGASLEAHLVREESLYFPPIYALRPDRRGVLARLLEAHGEIRAALGRIRRRLAERDLAGVEIALAGLTRDLADHEADEEAFLDALHADLQTSA